MIAYHIDRSGCLSPGQQICGIPCENPFGLPVLSQWGLAEADISNGRIPMFLDQNALNAIASHNMEVRAEHLRKAHFPDAVSRLSCFYAVSKLDHLRLWANILHIKPEDRVFEVYYEEEALEYDARNLRVSSAGIDIAHHSLDECLRDALLSERALLRYWSREFTDDPLPELLIPLPVTIGHAVSFNSLPQA